MAKAKTPATTAKRGSEPAREASAAAIRIRPLAAADWSHVADLFGDKGACGGCWCMYWRVARGGRLWDEMRGAPARRHFHDLVSGGKVQGLLAFQGEVPIGWVCVGPYADFPRLDTVRAFVRERSAGTWSIVCFYIRSKHRRAGLATKLLVAARDLALAQGARVVEGYPVTVNTPQGLPGAFAWTGVPAMFKKAGFRRLGDASTCRVWVSERAAVHLWSGNTS